ncbi:MAG: hypothetical protein QOE14_2056 [Humisphaera sp.]|nr:hypothetical protein [Humisphaera sp.]
MERNKNDSVAILPLPFVILAFATVGDRARAHVKMGRMNRLFGRAFSFGSLRGG